MVRPAWLTDEQYEQLRYDALTGRFDLDMPTVRILFTPPVDLSPADEMPPSSLMLNEVRLRSELLRSGQRVLIPEWADRHERYRWIPETAAAAAIAAWCIAIARWDDARREQAERLARLKLAIAAGLRGGFEST